MPSPLLLSIKDAKVAYNEKPIFENLTFNIHKGSRIALVGKNGAGKSTLMNIVSNKLEIEDGDRWQDNNIKIRMLEQDIKLINNETIYDYILKNIKVDERELHKYKADIVAQSLELETELKLDSLSGGELRRVGLAQALVEEPDILLLDEPTNHLDLDVIEWLENYLINYAGTLVCVSHDKAFLSNVTTKVFWIDRGKLKISPKGFKYFDEWSEMLLDQEERELRNRKQSLAVDVEWASRGVKARVKRNVRRLAKVKEMRKKLEEDERSFHRATSKVVFKPLKEVDIHSKSIAELYNVSKSFKKNEDEIKILDKFNIRIKKKDRIGILGKNGSGKTTFLKLILKEILPDSGSIKILKNMEFSYFDQKRSDLNPNDTLKDVMCPGGGDYVDVMGKQRHVYGYLKDFLFEPKRVIERVSQLSGGQKNRLMLAKILANPKSCLILDEPTNDLDMDTLDMLEEILLNYKGTLLVVSHDRDFLDQTVTKILAFEGNGVIEQNVGGYSDYLKAKKNKIKTKNDEIIKHQGDNQKRKSVDLNENRKNNKLSFNVEFEYKNLPEKISNKEIEINEIEKKLSDPNFYANDPDEFIKISKKLEIAKKELDNYETRWLEIDEKKTIF